MLKPIITLLAVAAVAIGANAATPYRIQSWRVSEPVVVHKPFMNDTVSPKGEKYKMTDLLAGTARAKVQGSVVAADTAGTVTLKAAPADGAQIQMLQTQLRSERFAKGQLKATSQVPFRLMVNGEEVAKKESVERDSVTAASTASASLRFEPEQDMTITVKTLVAASDSVASPTITVEFVPDQEYTAAVMQSGPDMLRRFSLDDSQYGNRVSGLSMSPDGKYLITKFYNYYSADRYRVYSTLTDLNTGKEVNANLPGDVRWMPSGSKLYFTAKAKDGYDVYSVDPVTGRQELIIESLPSDRFTWSPKEDYLIFWNDEDVEKSEGPLRRYTSPDDRMPGNRGRSYLSLFTPSTGVSQRLTFGSENTSLLDISPDGRRLLVMTSTEDPTVRPFYSQTVMELNLDSMKCDTIVATSPSFLADADYSPDGKQILFKGSPAAFNNLGKNCGNHPIANDFDNQLYIMTIADRSVKPITFDFAPAVEDIVEWNAADGRIYITAEQGFYKILFCYDPKTGKWTGLPSDIDTIEGATMGRDESRYIAYFGQGYHYAGRACLLNLRKNTNTIIADPRHDDLAEVNLSTIEPWQFTAKDGTVIDGVICYPPDFDPKKKYPLIVYYYGGTSPTQRRIMQPYTPQLFASRDYVVYVINPSGTTGYGQEFSARHVNAWGKYTADDIIEGVEKFCDAHPFVNRNKIGCLGASYGGFMTQYLQTQTPMFAAAVSHAGISNVTSYWGEGYWGYSYNSAAAADSYPWSNPDLFTKQGSLFNADKINTPLLLLHGTADTNVPIGESIQLFNALRILGKPVEFISVDGENHFISDYPKRQQWHAAIMAWFEKYLHDDPSWWNDQFGK